MTFESDQDEMKALCLCVANVKENSERKPNGKNAKIPSFENVVCNYTN